LAFCTPAGDDVERLESGYLFRDGEVRRLATLERRVVRDPVHGGPARIDLDGVDTDGRTLRATGEGVSRMFLPGHSLVINTMMRWGVDDVVAWGEDQDCWSMSDFAARLRTP
jgi:hypothetical protein